MSSYSPPAANTEIKFMFPEVEEGLYKVTLRNEEGDSESVEVELKMSISQSNLNMSVYGGKVQINGVGFPEEWPHPLFSINRNWEVV